jgi:phenylalanyl-tRNA synthetase alpha chain
MDDLNALVDRARAEFDACDDPAALENAKARYLGKAGAITEQLKALAKLDARDRPAAGVRVNAAKSEIERALDARRAALAEMKLAAQLAADALDVSLPGRGVGVGALHPLTRTIERI